MHQIWIETIWYCVLYDLKSICQIGAGLSDSARWFDAHQIKSVFVIVKYQILFFFSVLRVSPWNKIVPLLGMEYLKIWFDTHLCSEERINSHWFKRVCYCFKPICVAPFFRICRALMPLFNWKYSKYVLCGKSKCILLPLLTSF